MIFQLTTQEFLDITGALIVAEVKGECNNTERLQVLRAKLNEQFSEQVVGITECGSMDSGRVVRFNDEVQ